MMEMPAFLDDHLQYDGKPWETMGNHEKTMGNHGKPSIRLSMPSMIFSANHELHVPLMSGFVKLCWSKIQCLASMKQQSSDSNQQLIGYITILAHTNIISYIYNYQIYQYIMYFIP